jgi:hypothetical protein
LIKQVTRIMTSNQAAGGKTIPSQKILLNNDSAGNVGSNEKLQKRLKIVAGEQLHIFFQATLLTKYIQLQLTSCDETRRRFGQKDLFSQYGELSFKKGVDSIQKMVGAEMVGYAGLMGRLGDNKACAYSDRRTSQEFNLEKGMGWFNKCARIEQKGLSDMAKECAGKVFIGAVTEIEAGIEPKKKKARVEGGVAAPSVVPTNIDQLAAFQNQMMENQKQNQQMMAVLTAQIEAGRLHVGTAAIMPTAAGTDAVAGVGTLPGVAAADTPTAGTVPGSSAAYPGAESKSEAGVHQMNVEED